MQLKKEIKFETLKKSHKKQIIIGSVFVCVVSILTFNLTKAKYRLTQSMKLVTGTINYKVPDLRIVALYTENDNNEYVESDDVPTSGYALNEEKSICRVYDGTTSVAEAPKDELITIEYRDGRIYINDLTKKNTRCYLYFDKKNTETVNTILGQLEVFPETPDFRIIADKEEYIDDNNGIFKAEDGMYGGDSYYWRGAATTNHVIFANKCWRIVRINGDGSIRLIYNGEVQLGNTCRGNGSNSESVVMKDLLYSGRGNIDVNASYVGYTYTVGVQRPTPTTGGTDSNLKKQTDTWYNNNIGNNDVYKNKVADGKYCNDRKTKNNETWINSGTRQYYAAYARLVDTKTPTFYCNSQDVYTLKAGAITADEVSFAGGVYDIENKFFYLYNGEDYWTITPSMGEDSSYGYRGFMLFMLGNGSLCNYVTSSGRGVRPVINLRSDVTFNAGSDGTQNNPYFVQ